MKKKGKIIELIIVGLFGAIPAIYMALREDKVIEEKVNEALDERNHQNLEEKA